jgi:preprotein translocase subunit SecY
MLKAFRNALLIPDLRAKLFITLGLLAVYRLLVFIPTPGVDVNRLQSTLNNNLFGMVNFMSGGNFEQFSVAALGVIPYITASIIIQLLTTVYPPFEKLQKEGEQGRRKLTQYTRYGAIILGAIQAFFLSTALLSTALKVGWNNGPFFWFVVVITQVAGIALVMWLGEKISEFGLGNGISLIIYAGIVAAFPGAFAEQIRLINTGDARGGIIGLVIFLVLLILTIAGMVFIQQAERRIPVQYARQVVGRKVMGGQSTYIPMRLNAAGVIPIIFAVSILIIPTTILQLFPTAVWAQRLGQFFIPTTGWGLLVSTLLIMAFTYFYTQISFDPRRISDNLREYGGFVPGVRPGQPTTDYLVKITRRITLWGALFLGAVNALPQLLSWITGQGALTLAFSGTSILIMVGVALDTLRQIETQLTMRHYEGFVSKGRIRGRGRRF